MATFALLALLIQPLSVRAQSATPATDGATDPTISATSVPSPAAAAPTEAAPHRPAGSSGRTANRSVDIPHPAPPSLTAPGDLRRVGDWIAFRNARHLASLPVESRIFFRRGLIAKQAGQEEEALLNVRGAAELDPSYVEPHLTIAAWLLTREPSQALQQYAVVVELLRQNFNLQLGMAANLALIGFEALYFGLLMACLLLVWLRRDEITHAFRERLAPVATHGGAQWWALAVFVLPYFAGLGLTLPTLGFLAYLWPNLRGRERIAGALLLVTVLGTPPVLAVVERFSLPLHGEAAPFYDVPRLENMPFSPELEQRLATIARQQPDNGIVHFGLAWVARRGGHLATSEAAYRRVVQLWPKDDRALTNLGNVLAMEGRTDDAMATYKAAIAANPGGAAAYFNAAQLHTQRYEYQAATEALSRASALNFELVRNYQSQATTDGLLPLIDQWLEPRVFWATLRSAPIPRDMAGAVPIGLRRHIEASGWRFSLAALVIALVCFAAGSWQHRRLHLRQCSNCGDIVCRRCAERRREQALCPSCAALDGRAETPEAGRVLLVRQRIDRLRRVRLTEIAFAALIPGYGLLAQRRVFTPVLMLSVAWLLLMGWLGAALPLALEPRLTLPGDEVPSFVLIVGLACVYAVSLFGYLHHSEQTRSNEAELQRASRGRVTQSTQRVMHTAA
jgi:tetratricopeptide (TPR) repeat protein